MSVAFAFFLAVFSGFSVEIPTALTSGSPSAAGVHQPEKPFLGGRMFGDCQEEVGRAEENLGHT